MPKSESPYYFNPDGAGYTVGLNVLLYPLIGRVERKAIPAAHGLGTSLRWFAYDPDGRGIGSAKGGGALRPFRTREAAADALRKLHEVHESQATSTDQPGP